LISNFCRWISEKYDGVRARWNGKSFFSRSHADLIIPEQLTRDLPKVPLDVEIWFGNDSLTESLKVCLKVKNIDWDRCRFVVFDAPGHKGAFEGKTFLELNNSFRSHKISTGNPSKGPQTHHACFLYEMQITRTLEEVL
jgi:hypothetical protein